MAEQPRASRTEKPTSRRLQKSREQGQVPRSAELPAALVLAGVLLFGKAFGAEFLRDLQEFIAGSLRGAAEMTGDPVGLPVKLRGSLLAGFVLGAPIVACVALASAVGQFSQGGFVFSSKALQPNAKRFHVVQNLLGLFSLKRVVTTVRTVAKLSLVTWVVYATVSDEIPAILALTGSGASEILFFAMSLARRIVFKFLVFTLGLALADYLYQKFEHVRGLKMTKQEVKDERREVEGDPTVRGRQRSKQYAMARRRMMADVPKADVVVVNPTHCAVALRYDQGRDGAPRVLAKGVDRIAARIRALAEEHRVPVYENATLAWALYRAVEIGREIPADLYRAVAEVLAHVYRLRTRKRRQSAAWTEASE